MNHFHGVTDYVVLLPQSSEASQNRVINSLNKHHFLKRIILLSATVVVSYDKTLLLKSLHFILKLAVFLLFFSFLFQQVLQKLRTQAYCVLLHVLQILPSLLFPQKYCESWEPVEPLRREILRAGSLI